MFVSHLRNMQFSEQRTKFEALHHEQYICHVKNVVWHDR